ncbi:Inosine/uridine-preferring nucleoside hydrolase domain-containing protein [Rhodotorula diobovata]|uniref:Inosine/uridine-preferring nucleoside hydrolase domain-containing protein n=1 Tax=Rhodotorula diobovata TaxID=5288 RepID=A0A5C5G8C6_9BASI|nr:Inosine/uridine-preferring nucleoside hydrolase domain-containing protein [Rhodotorula diobovata]
MSAEGIPQKRAKVWLDCDPGRDDLVAILLALHLPEIELLGLSSVHGNASIEHMTYNAVRVLCSFGTPEQVATIPVHKGAERPLLVRPREASFVHGCDGLGGVEGLLDMTNPTVAAKQAEALKGNAVQGLADACRSLPDGEKLTLIATGSFTNVALFVSLFPDLVVEKVDRIVAMAGAEGRGNKSPVAESNVLCDPHAAAIVFDAEVPVVLCPLNLTHTALFTPSIHRLLLQPRPTHLPPTPPLTPTGVGTLPRALTPLRHTLSTNLSSFAEAYRLKYGMDGPPLHDALTVAFAAHPELFKGKRYRVDVELTGSHSLGATVVDLWDYKKAPEDTWGRDGKNVFVLEEVDTQAFWREVFLETVARADEVVPVNAAWREKRRDEEERARRAGKA